MTPRAGGSGSGDLRTAALLLLAFTLVYGLGTGGHVYSPDALTMARTAESLVDRGELAIPDPGYPPGFLTKGREGRTYAKYGLGMPVAAAPFVLVGRGVGALVGPELAGPLFSGPRFLWYDPADPGDGWTFFGASLTAAPLAAGAVALLFLVARAVGIERRGSLALAAVAGLASPFPVYAKTFFSEPLAAVGVTGIAWTLARWDGLAVDPPVGDHRERGLRAVSAGLFASLAVLAKVAHLLLVPLLVAILWWRESRRPAGGKSPLRAVLPFLAGLVPVGLFLAAANQVRFGSVLATGYGSEAGRFTTPLAEGLTGLLVSPGRGLLVYFPLTIVAVVAWPRAFRRAPAVALLTLGAFLVFLGLYAPWHGWDGGWTWGPRFFVPLVPLLVLTAAPWLLGSGWRRVAAWALAAVSAGINWIGTLVPFTEYHTLLREAVGGGYLPVARWSWEVWPPLAYLEIPWTYWLLPRVLQVPAAWPLAIGFGAAAGALPCLVWRIARPEGPRFWIPACVLAAAGGAGLSALLTAVR